MSLRTTSITITAKCDGYRCYHEQTATGATMAEARQQLRNHGWTILTRPYERAYCQPCNTQRARLTRDGILSRDGYVLDTDAYDRWLDERAAATA